MVTVMISPIFILQQPRILVGHSQTSVYFNLILKVVENQN